MHCWHISARILTVITYGHLKSKKANFNPKSEVANRDVHGMGISRPTLGSGRDAKADSRSRVGIADFKISRPALGKFTISRRARACTSLVAITKRDSRGPGGGPYKKPLRETGAS